MCFIEKKFMSNHGIFLRHRHKILIHDTACYMVLIIVVVVVVVFKYLDNILLSAVYYILYFTFFFAVST
jgi:hypothetical protein